MTYAELDALANQLAHYLRSQGAGGSRVAILLQRSLQTYVSLLAVGKAGAIFVPIDPGSPPDRVAYIVEDANVDVILTSTDLAAAAVGLECKVVELDAAASHLRTLPATRPDLRSEDAYNSDPDAYIIYTSGSSGRPKGVLVAQSSICNFLDVVPTVYDVRPSDRVYQGMTISFDFSIEEIWPTFAVGATLVVGPTDSRRLGAELADFLDSAGVTVMYCVPTLLATIPRELPEIRSLLVGGEACPGQLVERWSRPGRRILNTYGPTEATVTAIWCELLPGRPVVIGKPLPTYTAVLLDDDRHTVPDGEVGEICLGGAGVARGYVGRPDLTADKFIDHAFAPAGSKLYRTGDLGRLTQDGDIEYLGRADAEVKIRGHRVDLGEIESVLMEDDGVAEAVAAMMAAGQDPDAATELSAYVVLLPGTNEDEATVVRRLHEKIRDRVPSYMVPSFMDIVLALPTMPSGKVDRKLLPAPSGRRLALSSGPVIAAGTEMETRLRGAWAQAFGLDAGELSVEANFFTDLGGHSLLAATVVSLLRAEKIGTSPAVRDLYANPTVRSMAGYLDAEEQRGAMPAAPRAPGLRHRRGRIARAGFAQAVVIYLLLLVITLPVSYVYTINNGDVSVQVLLQLLCAILVSYLGVRWAVPLVVARPLAWGIKPGRYPLWGITYLRLWALDMVLAIGPLPVVSGSPLMAMYLRVLGAHIGRRTTIETSTVSLPGMVYVGRDASIGYGATIRPWKVEDGLVTVAPITIGPGAFVGANTVLEPGSTIDAGACLAQQSVIGEGERVPIGQRWSGSPAKPAAELDLVVEMMMRGQTETRGWRLHHLIAAVFGLAGLEVGAIATIVPGVALVWWALLTMGVLAGVIATILAGPVFVLTVCGVVAVGKRMVLPNTPVGIYHSRSGLGVRKWIADKLLEFSLTFTNSLYATLYTVPWLRMLGAQVGRRAEVSTAAHLDPDLLVLGTESFVADMASVGAATFANGRVAFLPTSVGSRAFVGNAAFVPAGSTLGSGSLVGVGTVPPDENVPEGTSWLGSPAMHLPLRQDSGSFSEQQTFRPNRRLVLQRLGIEFFRATLPASVLGLSFYVFLLALSTFARGNDLPLPAMVSPLLAILASLAVILYCVGIKRNVIGAYEPRVEPLWSPWVRRSEFVTGLFEAAAVPAGLAVLVGTPFLPPVLRWFGAKIGRRTWIGTTYLTEFDLVDIGDDATIGTDVSLQTHLFEDRVMKMSTVTIKSGASVGTRTIVLYDAVVDNDVTLGSLSLLMKGEHLTPGTRWHGIPAQGATEASALDFDAIAAQRRGRHHRDTPETATKALH
ncbi:non-ribosomal peptide synthetase [Fodinicola feengrottensis]|uniref:Non-ribosomal peptide synthetase n=1 Tax=Fodinicola feengrottensis TaxID=435914 RepID=A0ABN2FYT0_9ACTN